jgi:hypothetical protein
MKYYRQALFAGLEGTKTGTRAIERRIAKLETSLRGENIPPSFVLDGISGIGHKRKLALLQRCGNVRRISTASDAELLEGGAEPGGSEWATVGASLVVICPCTLLPSVLHSAISK